MLRSMRQRFGDHRSTLPPSSANESSSSFPSAARRERNYFPYASNFGTYFRLPCDSMHYDTSKLHRGSSRMKGPE
jgi:hypothetical protein